MDLWTWARKSSVEDIVSQFNMLLVEGSKTPNLYIN